MFGGCRSFSRSRPSVRRRRSCCAGLIPSPADPPLRITLAAVGLVFLVAAEARAAEPGSRLFDVAPSRFTEAMVAFALQGDVSVGAENIAACGARSPGVRGRLAPTAALSRLLAGTGCTFRVVGPRTYRLVRAVAPAPAPAQVRPPAPVQLPPAEASPPRLLEEIILTAPKLSGGADHVPYPVTVIGGARLEASGARGVGDLTQAMAGVATTNLGPGRNKILIRGVSDGPFAGRTQSAVGIYLDDIRITFDAPDPDLLLTDIEQVEVLRGPQGALYGSGSIGGVYRITPRKPDLGRLGGAVSFSGAETRGGARSGSLEAMVNAPIARDRLGLRLVAYSERTGGSLDNPRLGLSDTDETRRIGLRGALKLKIADGWSATLTAMTQGIDSKDAQYTDGLRRGTRATAILEPHDNDFAFAGLTIEGAGPWGRLRSSTALLHHGLTTRYDAEAMTPQAVFDDSERKESLVEDLNIASPPGRLQWLAGLFLASGEEEGRLDLTAAPMAQPYRQDRQDRVTEGALYGEATYAVTDNLKLTGGLRAFRARRTTTATVDVGGVSTAFSGRAVTQGIAPKLVAALQLSPALMVYGEAAEGYRPSGFSTGGLPQERLDGGVYRRFAADELWNYEAGAKLALMGGRLKARAALYQLIWRDLQSDGILPSGLAYTVNVGKARNFGAELEGSLLVGRRLTVELNVSTNSPEVARIDPSLSPLEREAPLPAVAGLTVGGSLGYERPIRSGLNLTLRLAMQHVGRSTVSFQARPDRRMGDYTSARLAVGLVGPVWRAGLYVENPADEAGDTFGYGNPFSFRRTTQQTPQRPRTVGLSVSAAY